MKALILAGGKGVSLQPLTYKIPKPMVPIMNKPLLERTMVNLKKSGIHEIVISSCYQTQYIEDYFGNGEHFGLKIQYIVEDIPLWNDVKIGREVRLIGSIITSNAFVIEHTNFINTAYSRDINLLYKN